MTHNSTRDRAWSGLSPRGVTLTVAVLIARSSLDRSFTDYNAALGGPATIRVFPDSGHLVIGMQTGDPPVRGQHFLDFVTQDSLDAVTYPLAAKTFSCFLKHINDGRNGIQYKARPFPR